MAWAPDYVTTAELKAFRRISDSVDDTQLALAIAAASRAIDVYTNRQFGLVDEPEARLYTAEWDRFRRRWVIPIDDLMTVTGGTVTTDAGDISVYNGDLRPFNATLDGIPYTSLVVSPDSAIQPTGTEGEVTFTATWGWTAVPDAVTLATLLQANRIASRRDSPYGVAGSPDLGSELRLLERLDPDVAVSLNPFRRWWAAA